VRAALGAALRALWLCGLAAALSRVDGAVVALAIGGGVLCAGEIGLAPEPRLPTGPTTRRGGWVGPAAATGLGLLALEALAVAFRADRGAEAPVVGAALVLSGGALRLWAIRELGASFRTEHEVDGGQALVRSGPYAFSRHPSEIGLLAYALGVAAFMQSWPAAAVWAAVLLPSSLVRIRREEALLRAAFPPSQAP